MVNITSKLKEITADISVLYAEDDLVTKKQYEEVFEVFFKEVKSVENGKEAIEEYNKKRYDLIITDLTMPIMDGIDLISEALKLNPSQHIIIMTAHNTNENLRSSIDFQVDGILLKPVSIDKLFQVLYRVCHLIYLEQKDIKNKIEQKQLNNFIHDDNQATFVVVIDKFKDIVNEFGKEIKTHIFRAVKEHLSYFGLDDKYTLIFNNDVLICRIDKHYLDNVLEALQEFSNAHNVLIVEFNNLKIFITISYGVIILDKESKKLNKNEELLHHIEILIDEIKNDEQSTTIIKMDINQEEIKKNNSLSWLGVTLKALKQETIVPFYQQIVDINTMKIVSYEVYSRLKQDGKYILPKFFIDLSKKAGILEDILQSVFKQSFQFFSSTEFSFHINISNLELRNDTMENYLLYLCSKYEIKHSRVILDILNYEDLEQSSKIFSSLMRLKKHGFKIALKGFATGSINIELLCILQPEYIKINQILILKSIEDSNIKSALSSLLDHTRSVHIKSILVGVETQDVLNEGRKFGFDYVQGYFIGKPSAELYEAKDIGK